MKAPAVLSLVYAMWAHSQLDRKWYYYCVTHCEIVHCRFEALPSRERGSECLQMATGFVRVNGDIFVGNPSAQSHDQRCRMGRAGGVTGMR